MQRGTIRIERSARGRRLAPELGDEARGRASAAARSSWFEGATRIGFVARALIYGIVGVLALKLALGSGGKATNQKGALEIVARQPFGDALVVALAVGFGAYALWRFVQAWIGRGPEGGGGRSTFKRLSAFGSGIAYAVLCATAVSVLLGSGGSGRSAPHRATAGVLGWPAGRWLVGVIGVGIVCIGLYQGYRGVTRRFLEEDKTEQMAPGTRAWIARAGTVGHLARAVVFGLIGAFAVDAAYRYDPRQTTGLDGALAHLQHADYGSALLGIVAAGLVAFAVFSLAEARYRRL